MEMFKYFIEQLIKMDVDLLHAISVVYIISGALAFVTLTMGITAPYGRYIREGWGIQINGQVAWFVQELPAFVIPVLFMFTSAPSLQKLPNVILNCLIILHYTHRTCIYPFLIRGGKPTPLVIFILTSSFCLTNGYLQTVYVLYYTEYGPDWWTKPHMLIGIPMFLIGMSINVHSDHLLRNLRKPGETDYKIPKGGMFNYVSGANFFGEMIEWTGFAIASWCIPAFAFAFFTCSNLGPRAYQHHQPFGGHVTLNSDISCFLINLMALGFTRFKTNDSQFAGYYLKKFDDYPKNRKALIPFVF